MRERSLWLRRGEPRWSPYLLDGFLGLGVGGALLVAFFLAPRTPEFPRETDALGVTLTVLAWMPLVFRRRAPVPVLIVTGVAASAAYALGYPDVGHGFGPMVALYTVATRGERRVTLAAVGGAVAANLGAVLCVDVEAPYAVAAASIAVAVGAAALGDRKHVRQAYVEQLELRAAERERERLEAARRAVDAERTRIARELHDVVAHAMSVVAVQSGVGAHVIDAQPGSAKRILETINDTSRAALAEMRRLLGVLRDGSGDDSGDDLAPAPGLRALGDLAVRVTEAGVPVEVRVEGEPVALPAGVDLAAYRIVQEALTNVLKHAGPARATVTVRYDDDAVHLTVTDDGRGAATGTDAVPAAAPATAGAARVAARNGGDGREGRDRHAHDRHGHDRPGDRRRDAPGDLAPPPARPGHGIVGMRERAELYGGSLTAGPRPGGGFRVRATLRLDAPVGTA
ncbi:MAG TPA: sensor histidine kinase [Acidimicrobiales bacterium]